MTHNNIVNDKPHNATLLTEDQLNLTAPVLCLCFSSEELLDTLPTTTLALSKYQQTYAIELHNIVQVDAHKQYIGQNDSVWQYAVPVTLHKEGLFEFVRYGTLVALGEAKKEYTVEEMLHDILSSVQHTKGTKELCYNVLDNKLLDSKTHCLSERGTRLVQLLLDVGLTVRLTLTRSQSTFSNLVITWEDDYQSDN